MQELEIRRDSDNPNMLVVTGPLMRDPAITICIDSMHVRVFDSQFEFDNRFTYHGKKFETINALTFLTMVGQDVEKFYNNNLG